MKINQNPLTKIIKNTKIESSLEDVVVKILYIRVSLYVYENGKDP